METSIFLARFLGTFIVIGMIAVAFNYRTYVKLVEEEKHNPVFVIATGMMALLLGLFIVVMHNVWTWGWQVIITLIGWAALLKGASRMFFPTTMWQVDKSFVQPVIIYPLVVIFLIVGLYLMFVGYLM
jgi:hypothetical protein